MYWSYMCVEFAKESTMPDSYANGWHGNKFLGHRAKSQARYGIYSWFAYNDLDLKKVKSERIEETDIKPLPPITLQEFGKIVKLAPLKWACALVVLLQSAVRIGDFFDQVGLLWPMIKEQIDKKTCIIRVNARGMEIVHEVPWREMGTKLVSLRLYGATTRGKTFEYMTFLGNDALDLLVRYVKERGEPAKGERLWDCDKTRLQKKIHVWAIKAHLMQREKGNTKGGRRYPYHIHRLRKLFKTNCILRGVSEADSESTSGHKPTGVDKIYDERHISHPEVFAAEYLKVEPSLNVVSNPEGTMGKATEAFIKRFEQNKVPTASPSGRTTRHGK